MKFGLEPIENRSPYKRIGIGELPPNDARATLLQEVEDAIEWGKNKHIWQLVVDTATGTNMPTSSPPSTGSRTDCEHTVCTDGWEAS